MVMDGGLQKHKRQFRIWFRDRFTRSDTGSDMGADWTDDAEWRILSNKGVMKENASSTHLALYATDLPSGNHYAQVNFHPFAVGTDDRPGIVVRYADADNYIRVYTRSTGLATYLQKEVATVWTTVDSGARNRVQDESVRIRCNGTHVTVYILGGFQGAPAPWFEGTISELTANVKVGLLAQNTQTNAGCSFDNFEAGVP